MELILWDCETAIHLRSPQENWCWDDFSRSGLTRNLSSSLQPTCRHEHFTFSTYTHTHTIYSHRWHVDTHAACARTLSHTHTRTHARTHARTQTHTHTHTQRQGKYI